MSKWKPFLFGIKIWLGKCIIYEQMEAIFICNEKWLGNCVIYEQIEAIFIWNKKMIGKVCNL